MTRWSKGSWDFKPSIFITLYIAKITVSWEGEVRDVITPEIIKKKKISAWHLEPRLNMQSWQLK